MGFAARECKKKIWTKINFTTHEPPRQSSASSAAAVLASCAVSGALTPPTTDIATIATTVRHIMGMILIAIVNALLLASALLWLLSL
jgi:hypothetical protein